MTDTLFATLLNMVDSRTTGEVAHALAQPELPVRQGMESSIAAVLSGLAAKSNDPAALQKIIDIIPSSMGQAYWSQMAGAVADPNSPLTATGKRLLPALFGSAENTITSGISQASNLSPGVATTLLTMAGPVVMSFIAKQLRDGELTLGSLRAALQRESTTIRNALPAGLSEVFWPTTATATAHTVSPVVAQSVYRESKASWILPAIIAGAVALALIGLFGRARRPPAGEASRAVLPTTAQCALPATVTLPQGGLGSRFLVFLHTQPSATSEFDANQLRFDTGSARLRPDAQAQLSGLATVLENCPNMRLKVVGNTDNVGNPSANLFLSRNRAASVVSQLERRGISADRLVAEGDGDQHPIADNATAAGRAQNRRVAIFLTQS